MSNVPTSREQLKQERQSPLTVDSKDLAALLDISERHLRNMQNDGTLGPQPLRLGRSVRFFVEEVRHWLRAGSKNGKLPDRRTWLSIKKNL